MALVSVIIPSLNSRAVRGVVDALYAQTRADAIAEIIVVGLDEPQIIQADPRVRFISTERPLCAAAARNLGLRSAHTDLLIVLDSDVFPALDWLARLLDDYARGWQVVGGGVMLARDNYWALADNLSLFHEFMIDQPAKVCRYLPTSNLLLDRSVLAQAGYLDESFPGAAGEDIDWTIRMRQAGIVLHFDPASQVTHRPARVRPRDIWRHGWWSGRNMSRVRRRYPAEYPGSRLLQHPTALVVLSPAIALVASVRLLWYTRRPLRDWLLLPAIFLTKFAWVWGAAREKRAGRNQD